MSNPTWPEGQPSPAGDSSPSHGRGPAEPVFGAPDPAQGWGFPQAANAPYSPSPYGPPAQQFGSSGAAGAAGAAGEYPYPSPQPAAPSQPLYGQPFGSGQYPPAAPYPQAGDPSHGFSSGYAGTYSRPLANSDPTIAHSTFGQPAGPSTPMYGYTGAPSAPVYGYPGAPSVPMYGQTGQWGPPSQGFPGPAGPYAAPPARKSRKGLWIALAAVVVVLVLVGSGAAVVMTQLGAPAAVAAQFCGALKTQNYSAAYGMFSSSLRQQVSVLDFMQGAQTLDIAQGNVTACGESGASGAYSYSFGSSTATIQTDVTRGTAGTLHGVLHLKQESGGWKVDRVDTSLLGVNLAALKTLSTFCENLKAQNYSAAYALLVPVTRDEVSQSVFTTQAHLHDQINGNITTCAVTSIPPSNSDSQDAVMVGITRSKLSTRTGQVELTFEGGGWKVNVEDTNLYGSDLGPLTVGIQFCADLKKGDYNGAYGLLAGDLKSAIGSEQTFATALTPPYGLQWGDATPDLSTYKASDTSASYDLSIKLVDPSSGQSAGLPTTLTFVKQGSAWQISNINFHS